MLEKQNKYSIRKLSVGAASVLIGVSIFGVNSQLVKADTVDSNNPQISKNIESVQNKPTNDTTDILNQKETAEKPETNVKQPESSTLSNGVDNSTIQPQGSNNPLNQTTEEQKAPQNNDTKPVSDNVKPNLNTAGQVQPVTPHKGSAETSLTIDPKRATNTRANVASLIELKTVANTNTNGGFDSSWGQLDVNQWKGSVVGDYYQLTSYTGDANHIIVPNDADFAKAGISTSGKQVGVTSSLMRTIFGDKTTAQDATVAFSKTNNKMVKAIDENWYDTWGHDSYFDFVSSSFIYPKGTLTKFDGSNLDVANVTDMGNMFYSNKISDVSPLANWNVNNVTDMHGMFSTNQISDLSPLSNWNTGKVTKSQYMFSSNKISDVSPLANWKVDNVSYMYGMFDDNSSIQTKNQAKRIINFAYPAGYTGKKQDPVTQTIDVPAKQVKVELTTKDSKPSNNILDWVTKTETPISAPTDPVYFQDYTVPKVANLVPSISTVAKQEADPNTPLNVVVTYTAAPVTVHFKDVDENADKDSDAVKNVLNQTMQLSGTYGSEVDLSNVKLPANFVLDDTLPSVQYGKTDSVTINLKHRIDNDTGNNLDLTRTKNRTITITKPDGKTTTTTQSLTFTRTATKDAVNGKITYSDWKKDKLTFDSINVPTVDGYTASGSIGSLSVTPDSPVSANVSITYNANPQSNSYYFVDDDEQGNQVGNTVEISGKTDQTIQLNIQVPHNYVASDNLPVSYKFSPTNKPMVIHLKHATETATKTNGGDLSKTVNRNIVIIRPDGKETDTVQSVTFTRTGIKDLVTGKISYNDWNQSIQTLNAMQVPAIDGYTASGSIEAAIVNPDSQDSLIKITYNANESSQEYDFVDTDSNLIEKVSVHGKTDEIVDTPDLPVGWVLTDPTNCLKNIKLMPQDKMVPVKVSIKHGLITINPDDVTKDKPIKGNPDHKPGDNTPNANITYDNLHTDITRIVILNKPHLNNQTIMQSVSFKRGATIDLVTGEIHYLDWQYADPKQTGFAEIVPDHVDGYTASANRIDKVNTVKATDKFNNILVNYTPNQGNQTINYIDSNGKLVGKQTVTGTTDQTVKVTPQLPDGYTGQIPETITIKPSDTPITIELTPKHVTVTADKPKTPNDKIEDSQNIYYPEGVDHNDLNTDVTRTITVTKPNGTQTTITQTIHFVRQADVDEVTKKVTYTDWQPQDPKQTGFVEVDVPMIDGYTPNINKIPKIDNVSPDKPLEQKNIDIVYTPNQGTQTIIYVDSNGKQVAKQVLTGKTDQTVAVPKLDDYFGQIPKTVTIKPSDTPIIIQVTKKQSSTGQPIVSDLPVLNIIQIKTPDGKVIKTIPIEGKDGEVKPVDIPDSYHLPDGTKHTEITINAKQPIQVIQVDKDSDNLVSGTQMFNDPNDIVYFDTPDDVSANKHIAKFTQKAYRLAQQADKQNRLYLGHLTLNKKTTAQANNANSRLAASSVNNKNNNALSKSQNTLPLTGDANTLLESALGAILLAMGLTLVFAVNDKNKHKYLVNIEQTNKQYQVSLIRHNRIIHQQAFDKFSKLIDYFN